MNSFGVFPCDDNLRKGIKNIDIDSKCFIQLNINIDKLIKLHKIDNGEVDFEEFINMMSKFRKFKSSNELEDELKDIFNVRKKSILSKINNSNYLT